MTCTLKKTQALHPHLHTEKSKTLNMTSLLFSASDDADIFDDLAAQIGGGDTAAANVEMTTSTAAVFNSIEIPKSIEHLDDKERDSLFEYVVDIIYQFNGYVPPLHRSYINQIAGNNTAETIITWVKASLNYTGMWNPVHHLLFLVLPISHPLYCVLLLLLFLCSLYFFYLWFLFSNISFYIFRRTNGQFRKRRRDVWFCWRG